MLNDLAEAMKALEGKKAFQFWSWTSLLGSKRNTFGLKLIP